MLTIDHLIACHDAAHRRDKAGLPRWDRNNSDQDLLQDDIDNNEHVVKVARALSSRLRAALPADFFDEHSPSFDSEIDEIAGYFAQMAVGDAEEGKLVDYIDDWLSQLYDWADRVRVWLK